LRRIIEAPRAKHSIVLIHVHSSILRFLSSKAFHSTFDLLIYSEAS
jgi:hypothetical protein